ncbi:MAG: ATP-binding protein [Bacteroidetes bacterium]|nr:ATP-binding protein [Bacteroidota bacterium]MBU1116836.1 ATP-binding protein [Bacteroidota bacterium]MBU1799780.1 ATP-binding protein [Bacteroidota bacterium]
MLKNRIENNYHKYRLELRHITVLAFILISFQVILTLVQRSSFHELITETQHWYQRNSAERLANSNSTALELLIENMGTLETRSSADIQQIIQSFNIILTQQILEQNIEDVAIFVIQNGKIISIDEGIELFNFLEKQIIADSSNSRHANGVALFKDNYTKINNEERIISFLRDASIFEVLVPLAPNGELIGAFYMKNIPDFSRITSELLTSYNQIAIIYVSLILLGLLTMYYISSYTMKERDIANQKLFDEQQKHLKEQIEHEKETLFTKRIYHTHHKAEKVMGFIKDDLRNLSTENINETKQKVTKYANFVARAIYDMKWYDPPLQTIRNQLFNTDINEAIRFIVDNIFLRISSKIEKINFNLNLDPNIPRIKINEFVVWEIIEPLVQNSIDHAPDYSIIISITTKFLKETNETLILIEDDGKGILQSLLETNEIGLQKIFMENITTKKVVERSAGYGCYIAHQLATKRCGWNLTSENLEKGCRFTIRMKN